MQVDPVLILFFWSIFLLTKEIWRDTPHIECYKVVYIAILVSLYVTKKYFRSKAKIVHVGSVCSSPYSDWNKYVFQLKKFGGQKNYIMGAEA